MIDKKDRRKMSGLLKFCLIILSALIIPCIACAAGSNAGYEQIMQDTEKDLEYAQKYYENTIPNADEYNRKAEKPLKKIEKARYKQGKDGIYRADLECDQIAVIMCTGDLMCQKNQQREAIKKYGKYIFDDNFTYVKNTLAKADFVVGNLETMLSESVSYFSEQPLVDDSPNCNAPSTFLDALRYAGFDMTVTANNHNCDTGARGIFQTLGHLDQYKLIHTGLFRNAEEKRYKIVEIDGINVGFLSYSTLYNKNKHYTKEGESVLLNRYSYKKAKGDIESARADGAEFVITYIHWGIEYDNTESDEQKKIAKELAEAGSDYIIGSHPHCLQPYDRIQSDDGRTVPVVYSMGNFVSQMKVRPITQDSMILKISLARKKSGKVYLKSDGYIPCKIMTEYKGNNLLI